MTARFAKLLLTCLAFVPGTATSAGVTVITHGLNGNVDGWVLAMAGRMGEYHRFPGATFTCYELYFAEMNSNYTLTWRRIEGPAPSGTDSGEILIKLDWRQLANNDYSTYQVAAAVVPRLLQTNFIAELNGHALAELPLHLIGHSRGASLVCEMSRLLGTNGVWVDHLTTLDPHPLNNDGFFDFPYTVVDASAQTYENVLFHDNYYQTLGFITGEPVAGAYIRKLTSLNGGYGGFSGAHSDVHLWYHGTADLRVLADDSEATITASERQTWWTAAEAQGLTAGFQYSLIGGGDRLSQARPAGSGTGQVRDGYNQVWDLGAGASANRVFLPSNNGNWPNVLRLNLAGTNLISYGESNAVNVYAHWAKPATSNALISLYLDDDFNPYNANARLLRQFSMAGTGRNELSFGALDFEVNASNATPGEHSMYAVITAGGRSRYLYAPDTLTVFSSFAPPRLQISRGANSEVHVDVIGVPGQRVVLEDSTNLRTWRRVGTNWLMRDRWRYSTQSSGARFYRGVVR